MPALDFDYSHLGPTKLPPLIKTPLRVGIVPTPHFTLMSLGCIIDVLRLAGDESDFSRQVYCTWDVLSHDDMPITASCGMQIHPTKIFGDPSEFDYIIVHGGILHNNERPCATTYEFVETAARMGVKLVGCCTGTVVLAELGLLNGKRCAVHFDLIGTIRRYFSEAVPVTDSSVVCDGNIITSPGGLAAVNLAMFLVAEACGESRSQKAYHYLLGDRGFESVNSTVDHDPRLKCLDRRVEHAVELMRQKLYELCSVSDIAASVGTSERELSRLFRRHLQISPALFWRQMRLKSAKWFLLNSDRSIAQIAYECGFADSAHFVRGFKREYNTTPSRFRRSHWSLGVR